MSSDADRAALWEAIQKGGLFDPAWYALTHGDVAQSGMDPAAHYRRFGLPLRRKPCADLAARVAPLPGALLTPEARADLLDHFGVDADSAGVTAAPPPEFDEAFYLLTNQGIDLARGDAWGHFLSVGYRELRNPSPDFDLVWYTQMHAGVIGPGENAFLHYLRHGKARGDATRPPRPVRFDPAASKPLPSGARRACLFAGYDPQGRIDPYVVIFLTELSRHADVFYLADGDMAPGELARLDGIAKGAWARRHGAYDFGSYAALACDLVGWDRLAEYDEVLFVNDSNYLVRPLDAVFDRMNATPCAWWGLQATKGIAATRARQPFPAEERLAIADIKRDRLTAFEDDPVYDFLLGSFFLAFRRDVLDDPRFRAVMAAVRPEPDKAAVIRRHEIGLTRFLIGCGYEFGCFVDHVTRDMPVYTEVAFDLIAAGYPLFKRLLIAFNPYRIPSARAWKPVIADAGSLTPPEVIEHHLRRTGDGAQMHRAFGITVRGKLPEAPRTAAEFVDHDAVAPKFGHWWAFPTGVTDGWLAGNARAVFDAVRDDPAIRKIVLTRDRVALPEGRNVIGLRLSSREGQEHLARARTVIMRDMDDALWPLSPDRHHLILLGHGSPLVRRRPGRNDPAQVPSPTAVLAGSEADRPIVAAQFPDLPPDAIWITGPPQQDILRCAEVDLPPDLAADVRQLRGMLAGRRMILFAPTRRAGAPHPFGFSPEQVAALAAFLGRVGMVLGLRAHPADTTRVRALQPRGAAFLDLGHDRFAQAQIVLRAAEGLISDYSTLIGDALATGRPVIRYAPDQARFLRREATALHDPGTMGPMAMTFDALMQALESFTGAPADTAPAPQHDPITGSEQVVARLRGLVGGTILGANFRRAGTAKTARSILFLHAADQAEPARRRAYHLVPALRRRGWTATVADLSHISAAQIARVETVVMCRLPLAPRSMDIAESVRALGGRVICDLDALLWDPDVMLAAPHARLARDSANAVYELALRRRQMLDLGDGLTVATPALAESLMALLGRPVAVVPDALSDRDLAQGLPKARHNGPLRLVHLAGEHACPGDTESCLEQVRALLAAAPGTELHLIGPPGDGAPFAGLTGPQVIRHGAVSPEAIRVILSGMDLALAPRAAGELARAGSGPDIVAAAAAGVPAIAAPEAVTALDFADGTCGWLARSPEDWGRALDQLAADAALRARMGTAARARLVAPHDPDHVVGMLIDVVQRLTERGA